MKQSQLAQVQHDFGNTAGEKDLNGDVSDGAIGQRIDEARDLAIDLDPIFAGRAAQAGGVGDRGDVQEQVGRSAERRVDDHRVTNRLVGQHVAQADGLLLHRDQCAGGAGGEVEPDGLAAGGQRRVWQGHAQRFAHHLRGCGGAQELTPAAW